jgi:hypothetical protein
MKGKIEENKYFLLVWKLVLFEKFTPKPKEDSILYWEEIQNGRTSCIPIEIVLF